MSDPKHLVPPPPPQPLDVVAWVTVRLHQNGTISTSGTIGDKKMAVHLLDQARDAVKRQVPEPTPGGLIVPSRDVAVMPSVPTKDMAHIAPHERGDP